MTPATLSFQPVVDHGRPRLQRLLGVEHGRKHLILHLDEVEGPLGRVDVHGGNGGDPIADVAGLVGEDELILVLSLIGERRETPPPSPTG